MLSHIFFLYVIIYVIGHIYLERVIYMNSKLPFSAIVLIILVIITCCGYFGYEEISKEKRLHRYDEIRTDVRHEMERYWYLVMPTCNPNETTRQDVSSQTLIREAAMDKEKFLDVDGKNYCSTLTYATCIYKNVWEFETFIKCKDYEDKEYRDLGR